MADPTTYTVTYSFSGYQATAPSDPLPASSLDNELANIATAIASLVGAVTDVRREDGALPNGIVTLDSLATEVGTRLGVEYDSAYDVAVANGYEGTVSEWLDSLVGEQGEQGEQGPAGEMSASVYDPNGVEADAFSMDNMTEGNETKILTSAERTAIATIDDKLDEDDVATAAQFRANSADKVLVTDEYWSAHEVVALIDAATISLNMSAFINASVTITGNRTLGNPSVMKVGQTGCIKVTASGATRTLAKGSSWKSSTTFPISIASGESAYLYYHVFSSTEVIVDVVNDPS